MASWRPVIPRVRTSRATRPPLTFSQVAILLARGDYYQITRRHPAIRAAYRSTPPLDPYALRGLFHRYGDHFLTTNRFPYHVQPYHYLLWCRNPTSLSQAHTLVRRWAHPPFLLFENPIGQRSIPHTQHYHLLTEEWLPGAVSLGR